MFLSSFTHTGFPRTGLRHINSMFLLSTIISSSLNLFYFFYSSHYYYKFFILPFIQRAGLQDSLHVFNQYFFQNVSLSMPLPSGGARVGFLYLYLVIHLSNTLVVYHLPKCKLKTLLFNILRNVQYIFYINLFLIVYTIDPHQ